MSGICYKEKWGVLEVSLTHGLRELTVFIWSNIVIVYWQNVIQSSPESARRIHREGRYSGPTGLDALRWL